jgi:hypothetical protein
VSPDYTDSEKDVESAQADYLDYDPKDAFTVTGHLKWIVDQAEATEGTESPVLLPRVMSKMVFESVEQATAYMTKKYGRVYRDASRPDFGIWGGVVPKAVPKQVK